LSDAHWQELQRQLPLQPLAAYGLSNGLVFERATEAAGECDGVFLIAHPRQANALFALPSQVRRYLLLRSSEQFGALQ
ncbi:hypothetical protein SB761_36865, partial [Pseudomonas sp. SIMBA_064]